MNHTKPFGTSIAALGLTLLASTVSAHATLEQQSAAIGATYKGVMRIGHGCDGEATQSVTITIPEGVIAVKPMPKPGWTLETETSAHDQSYDYYGTPVTEEVTRITWTGSLDDARYDEFIFRAMLTDSLAADTIV